MAELRLDRPHIEASFVVEHVYEKLRGRLHRLGGVA